MKDRKVALILLAVFVEAIPAFLFLIFIIAALYIEFIVPPPNIVYTELAFLLFVALSAISIVCGTVIFVIWNIIAYFKQSDS